MFSFLTFFIGVGFASYVLAFWIIGPTLFRLSGKKTRLIPFDVSLYFVLIFTVLWDAFEKDSLWLTLRVVFLIVGFVYLRVYAQTSKGKK